MSTAVSIDDDRAVHTAEPVLTVEDDNAARSGLTELVRAWGYDSEAAADGQEGLEKITTYRPAAVLADMVMPRMDGLELLRRVKDQLTDLTFVLITAQGSVDTAVSAMKEGAYDYLTKPVDPQRLRTLLTHVAERQTALRDVVGLRRQLQEHGGPVDRLLVVELQPAHGASQLA